MLLLFPHHQHVGNQKKGTASNSSITQGCSTCTYCICILSQEKKPISINHTLLRFIYQAGTVGSGELEGRWKAHIRNTTPAGVILYYTRGRIEWKLRRSWCFFSSLYIWQHIAHCIYPYTGERAVATGVLLVSWGEPSCPRSIYSIKKESKGNYTHGKRPADAPARKRRWLLHLASFPVGNKRNRRRAHLPHLRAISLFLLYRLNNILRNFEGYNVIFFKKESRI